MGASLFLKERDNQWQLSRTHRRFGPQTVFLPRVWNAPFRVCVGSAERPAGQDWAGGSRAAGRADQEQEALRNQADRGHSLSEAPPCHVFNTL